MQTNGLLRLIIIIYEYTVYNICIRIPSVKTGQQFYIQTHRLILGLSTLDKFMIYMADQS